MSKARIIADYAGTGADTDLATQDELDAVSTVANAAAPKANPDFTGTVDLTGTTVSLDDDEISLDKVNGGTLGTGTIGGSSVVNTSGAITTTGAFTSVGIDDNADATAITINANEQVLIKQTAGVTGYTGYGAGLHVQGDTTSSSYAVPFVIKSADHDKAIIDVWEARDSDNNAEFHVRNPDDGANRFVVTTSNGNATINTGNLVIGTSGKGIDFSATSDATGKTSELLDDYEEGTWSPRWYGAGDGTTTFTDKGRYTKIGNMVYCELDLANGSSFNSGYSGALFIDGLPFTGGTTTSHIGVGSQPYFYPASNWLASNEAGLVFMKQSGTDVITVRVADVAGDTDTSFMTSRINGATGVYFGVTFSYFT